MHNSKWKHLKLFFLNNNREFLLEKSVILNCWRSSLMTVWIRNGRISRWLASSDNSCRQLSSPFGKLDRRWLKVDRCQSSISPITPFDTPPKKVIFQSVANLMILIKIIFFRSQTVDFSIFFKDFLKIVFFIEKSFSQVDDCGENFYWWFHKIWWLWKNLLMIGEKHFFPQSWWLWMNL